MTFPVAGFDFGNLTRRNIFVRGVARASEARSALSRANCAPVIPDTAALVELERHRWDSIILRTSASVRVIASPETRHAPRALAILRTRLAGQPKCLARASGVVTSGKTIASIYSAIATCQGAEIRNHGLYP